MNNARRPAARHLQSLHLLDELASGDSLTQRELSTRLGMALGMVNSHIRTLTKKGFITVKAVPPKRHIYNLTSKGLAEKTRLAYHLLHGHTRVHREVRSGLKKMFSGLSDRGVERVAFAGADETAELAYLTLQEAGLKLAGVVDGEMAGGRFFGRRIRPLEALGSLIYDRVVVASYLRRESLYRELLDSGAKKREICLIFPV